MMSTPMMTRRKAKGVLSTRLQKRIEHLEAIITSEQWESPTVLELDDAPGNRKQSVR